MTRARSSHAAQVDVMEAPKKQKGRAEVAVKVTYRNTEQRVGSSSYYSFSL